MDVIYLVSMRDALFLFFDMLGYILKHQKWRVHQPSSPAIKTTDTGVRGLEDPTALRFTIVNIANKTAHMR